MKKRGGITKRRTSSVVKMKKIKCENKILKEELKEVRNIKLIKRLNASLDRISKGRFVTRDKLGL